MIAFFSNNSGENCRSENQKNGIDARADLTTEFLNEVALKSCQWA